jgi:hypothetical protein
VKPTTSATSEKISGFHENSKVTPLEDFDEPPRYSAT